MTTEDKLIKKKLSLIDLAEYLQSVSQACKINGVSRQHFYDIKKAFDEEGMEGLREKTRRKPCIKNRVAPEIEEAVINMAYEFPAYGQTRAANELRKAGILVSSGGVRSIWLRHNLETFKKRLILLKRKPQRKGSCTRKPRWWPSKQQNGRGNPIPMRSKQPILDIFLARIPFMWAI